MKAFIAFGLLILIGFLGSRRISRAKGLYNVFRFFFVSGLTYIFLGIILGKYGANVLSPVVLRSLSPLISLGLGWTGFLFGFQLEARYLRKFPLKYIGFSSLHALFVFLLVAVCFIPILIRLLTSQETFLLFGMATAFGLLSTLSSPTLLTFSSPQISQKGNYYYLARFLSSIGGIWGIVGLAFVSSFWRFPFFERGNVPQGLILLLCSTAFAMVIGYLFHLLTRKKASDQELLVYILGMVFFTSGTAFYFNFCPIYVTMVVGVVYTNFSHIQEKVYPLLLSTEKPFFIIFLVLIGALWEVNVSWEITLLVFVLLTIRLGGFSLFTPLIGSLLRFPFPIPPLFGLSLMSLGGIAVAFAVSIRLTYPMPLTDIFISVALIAIIINELFSPLVLRYAFLRLDREG